MLTPIRVLKFLNNFFIGGTERQFVHVANGLDRSRFSVEVGCLNPRGPLLEKLNPDMPVRAYELNGSFYTWHSVRNQFRLMRDVRAGSFDVVHTYGFYPNVFAIPPSRLARRPAIIASIRDAGAYMTPVKTRALKFVCGLADRVLANSAAGRTWLMEQGVNERKIEIIRNGIVVPELAQRRERPGPPVCACIGRVVSGKGIDDYLRAAQILAERGRDIKFLMIGAKAAEEHYQSDLEILARKLRVADRVIFTGQRDDVAGMLRDVDVVVHPSLTEGLSNVILEAMAAAVPVVATRVGGNPELVEDGVTGFLVPPQNAEAIADAVCRLLDNPEMARSFGERARRRVIDEFKIDGMLSKVEALYLRLAEERSGTHSVQIAAERRQSVATAEGRGPEVQER